MNESNESIKLEGSMYTSVMTTTTLFVALFWTSITLLSWLLRNLLLWLFNSVNSTQTTKESTKSLINSKLLAKFPFVNIKNLIYNHLYLKPNLLLALLDAVATIELCACSLECWIVREVFGYWGFLFAIALNCIRSSLFVSLDAYGNPCNPWYRFLLGQTQPIWLIFTWTLQLLSASIALKLCIYWWSLQLTHYHSARYELSLKMLNPEDLLNYTSDLQVTVSIGFLCEALATFVDLYLDSLFSCILESWNSHYLNHASQIPSSTNLVQSTVSQASNPCDLTRKQYLTSYIVRLLIILTSVAYGLEWTGMYLNPANAFIQSWGIGNITPINHIIVYWFGPMFGVWLYSIIEKWSSTFISKIIMTQ
uniref:Transmembrane protein n=1 Tax=Schistosoma mansoni TaxID=6183 RepID=A0A5K4F002_SCHMA